jgi:hypothetical protein
LNLRILSQELYKKSTSTPTGRRMNVSSSATALQTAAGGLHPLAAASYGLSLGAYDHTIQEPSLVDSAAHLRSVEDQKEDYFGPQRLQDLMRLYVQGAGFPVEFLDHYNEEKARKE